MSKINKQLLSNITLLYVEDEVTIREEVEYFLSKFIKNIYVASNGKEGLDLYHKINPDIIITDVQMPIMNGLDMIREINNKNVPIMIATAYSDVEFFLEAIELKVSKFVIKPMSLIDMLLDIQTLILDSSLKDKLFEKDRLLDIIDENVLLSVTDKNGVIIDASDAFCKFVEYSKDELVGNTHQMLRHEDVPSEFYDNMWKQIIKGDIFKSEIKNRKKSGDIYWANLSITPVFKDGEIENFTAIRQDITDKKRLENLAIRDGLTNLYNRRYFNEIIEKEIRRVKRNNSTLSLVILDVDYFKKYNDVYGHPEGDSVLINISKLLLKKTSRSSDYVFRLGGEEFGIIFSSLSKVESLEFINEIVDEIRSLGILHKENKDNNILTISAGIVVQNAENIKSAKELYKYSDQALYKAKQNGRDQVVISDLT